MKIERRKLRTAEVYTASLNDIMFFLLASFMLVSLSMTQMHRVPINLPSASTGIADHKAPPFEIAAGVHGRCHGS